MPLNNINYKLLEQEYLQILFCRTSYPGCQLLSSPAQVSGFAMAENSLPILIQTDMTMRVQF